MSEITFQDLALAGPIQTALKAKGYTTPSPIQAKAIPVLLEGHDLLACAQTGTGKTAAFALPVLDGFARNPRKPFRRGVRCLILTPTRELAVQVTESFKTYGEGLGLKVGMVFGGVSEKPQIKALYAGLDILVATTGRLLDLKQQGHVDISQVDTFILDEADRMLDMGFIRDIQKIAAALPQQRHTLLFSATMAPEITKLANGLLHTPKEIRIAPQGTTAEKIDQHVCFVKKADKQKLLLDLIHEHRQKAKKNELSLIFSRTKHGAKNLARKLCAAGIEADSLHGNKSQNARQKTLEQYKRGEVRTLVATDVAARGIDVKNITLVINFDLPMESDAYVHRIGRTARAGSSGKALSFCSEDEVALLRQVEKLIKRSVPVYQHEYHAAAIEHHHTSGAPAQKPKQGGGGGRGGNRGPRGGGGGGGGKRGPRSGGGGKRGSGQKGRTSGNPKPQSDSRPTGGFQKGAGQRSNRSRGRNR